MRGAKALYLALTSRLPFSNLLHLTTILKGAIMGWVTDNFRKRMHLGSRESNHGQSSNGSFESQADRKWTELVRALELDTEEFRGMNGKADFKQQSDFQCRISNPEVGAALVLTADLPARSIQYSYEAEHKNVAVPEGGFLSLRSGDSGVALYSADQQLTTEQARRLVLEPLLFPPAKSLEKTGT